MKIARIDCDVCEGGISSGRCPECGYSLCPDCSGGWPENEEGFCGGCFDEWRAQRLEDGYSMRRRSLGELL